MLDEIASPNLQIILDPVNLLCKENAAAQREIIEEAFALLRDDIAVIHLKDYEIRGDEVISVAAGEGSLDYPFLLERIKKYKPYIHCTLENTVPENAVRAREFVEKVYEGV